MKFAQEPRVRVNCTNTKAWNPRTSSDYVCSWSGYRRDVTRALDKPCPACGGRVERSFPEREGLTVTAGVGEATEALRALLMSKDVRSVSIYPRRAGQSG